MRPPAKRTLFTIIAVLVVLDLAALMWYLIGTLNSDGRHADLFERTDSAATEMADTVADNTVDDHFRIISDTTHFIATGADLEGTGKRQASTMCIKLKWPVDINGNDNLQELEDALINAAFGQSYNNVNEAIAAMKKDPKFSYPVSEFTRVARQPDTTRTSATKFMLRAFPYISTDKLLEYIVLQETRTGSHVRRKMLVVHYDRVKHNVFTAQDVLNFAKQDSILALVNQRIEGIAIETADARLHETANVPLQFLLGRKSVIFYFPDGAIAPLGTGVKEVAVSNQDIKPYFTDFYRQMLYNDAHLKAYPFLSF